LYTYSFEINKLENIHFYAHNLTVQKYDVEEVDKINERRVDLLTTLVEENHKEFFSGEGITDYLRPQPLLALDNVTHSCILTTRCYHRTYRTDDITESECFNSRHIAFLS
jgi:hypothetical protein